MRVFKFLNEFKFLIKDVALSPTSSLNAIKFNTTTTLKKNKT